MSPISSWLYIPQLSRQRQAWADRHGQELINEGHEVFKTHAT
jgi:hypothetical protein